MTAADGSQDRYGILVYNDQPVADQKKVGDEIRIFFCDGKAAYVSQSDWRVNKRFVFVPKSCGTREQIVKDWRKYGKFASTN